MGIIWYGAKETPIDVDEMMIKCPRCDAHHIADILVMSKYYHIYWIPMFPFEKPVSATCQACGLFRSDLYLDNKLVTNYEEIKRKFPHPWFTYTGIGIFTIIILSMIISSIFYSP